MALNGNGNHRFLRDRYRRRPIRVHAAWTPDLPQEEGLPVLEPAPPRRKRKARQQVPQTIAGLIQTVITAVNARGMCATQAARVAELPAADIHHIESLCACPECLLLRAS
jgi:hypothetical protein